MSLDIVKRRILDRVDLTALIGERVKLSKRSGRDVGLCPFHTDKSPSFTLYDDHYYCFGCHAHGDAIDYVRHEHGFSFVEALRHLAEKFNVEAPELDETNRDRQRRDDLARQFRVLQAAQSWFLANLKSDHGATARAYLEGRGFEVSCHDTYGFGLAPDDPAALLQHLRANGYRAEDAVAASLGVQARNGRHYDFFQHRLMIPIQDRTGRVIAFGGRALGDDPAKYKNSRETELFEKSRTLFGLHRAKDAIRAARRAIVVEGYMDALTMAHGGFPETVACLGTAFTLDQLKLLSQFTDRIYLLFDGDNAGRQASLRAVTNALEVPKAQVKVVALPEKEDPDSFLRKSGADAFHDLLANAEDILEYAVNAELKSAHDLAVPEIVRQKLCPWLLSIHDHMQRSYLVNRIATMTGIPADDIRRDLGEKRKSAPAKKPDALPPRPIAAPATPARALRPLEYELLGHLYFAEPGELDLDALQVLLKDQIDWDDLWSEFSAELIASLRLSEAPRERPAAHWTTATHPRVLDLLGYLKDRQPAFSTTARGGQMARLIQAIRRDTVRRTISLLKGKLNTVLNAQDREETQRILSAITHLNQELTRLEKDLQT